MTTLYSVTSSMREAYLSAFDRSAQAHRGELEGEMIDPPADLIVDLGKAGPAYFAGWTDGWRGDHLLGKALRLLGDRLN
jgi:hypothetical protein